MTPQTPQGAALSDADLKPCPFCDGQPAFERRGTPRQSCIVVCGNCGCRHECSDEDERSGQSWNDRAADRRLTAEQGGADDLPYNKDMVWLWTHCRAIGMVKESDSGSLRDDIALFTITLNEALRAALTTQPQAEPRKDGSISFEEAQDLARRHAKAEPESYYSEPFEPHLWVINAIVEASATWYERAVQERVRRVKAEAATAQPQAEPAFNPDVRARTLLSYLWRKYDAAGLSMGRNHEAVLLETAMDLLGCENNTELVDDYGDQVGEARDYLSARRAAKLGFALATPTAPTEPT